ncbi:hypothetical protein K443DRAFT_7663 [Laccaria amethystina LaAM-08-1]|uniref:Uncharacterized protein n=1 Tax=Laccaria amethystina LaAM-08-1 TaxID=1095629 RepID=A0A0C9WQE6_9AGAR|nr:hypothetical protein K443DRAFT_7663 [Laccaria amethystina LaAM-08-1]
MVEAYSRLTKGNGKIIIVGRNRTAADNIIAKLPQSSSQTPPLKFVQCDATLMRNVHATSSEILANHPKINFLVMSLEFMTTKGRDETEEGIDRKLAVHYYARWAFTNDLMPALQKASEDGEEANVFSVLGAGKGADIDVKDLGLKKTYSVGNAGLAAPTSIWPTLHTAEPFILQNLRRKRCTWFDDCRENTSQPPPSHTKDRLEEALF